MMQKSVVDLSKTEQSKSNAELDKKHEHLITEIESSEGHTASTLRYDTSIHDST